MRFEKAGKSGASVVCSSRCRRGAESRPDDRYMREIISIFAFPVYVIMFLVLYYQVFLLISFFDTLKGRRRAEAALKEISKLSKDAPSVMVMVPCYNEEETVIPTIESLLNLNYPEDKLNILVIDDGSTDRTYKLVEDYIKNHPEHRGLSVITKPNGGKHSALNLGLEYAKTDLVGCLDADSFADPDSLREIVKHFEDEKVMAVTPGIKVYEPKTMFQHMQKAEYAMGIFLRQALSTLDGIHVTPGPLSIFRRSVFENLGGYRRAHNTEDLEIALRMHRNGYRIVNAEKAFVYTVTPRTFGQLLKQRVRWSQGFLRNIYEYRDLLFSRRQGNLGMLVLPMSALSVFSAVYIFIIAIATAATSAAEKISELQLTGLHFEPTTFKFSWFVFSANWMVFVMYALTLTALAFSILGRKIADGKINLLSRDLWLFTFIYGLVAPLWLSKAAYEALMRRQNKWKA